jgi:hypothetical protein
VYACVCVLACVRVSEFVNQVSTMRLALQ